MKYKSAPDFRQALEMRLPPLSEETGRSLVRLRKEVAFDRLLARLVGDSAGSLAAQGRARAGLSVRQRSARSSARRYLVRSFL